MYIQYICWINDKWIAGWIYGKKDMWIDERDERVDTKAL